jgi:uncharacterized protein (TIGR02246 family)
MFHRTMTTLAIVMMFAGGPNARAAQSAAKKDPHAEDRAAIEVLFQKYADAVSKQDLKTIGGLWSEEGTYEDRQTGETIEGRKAILADMENVLKQKKGLQLSIHVSRVRFIKPDVAKVDGEAAASSGNDDATKTPFVAVLSKSDGQWLIDSVEETASAIPASAHEALKELEWLIGKWKDDSPDVDVETTGRWSASGSFILRSFTFQRGDDPPHQLTQVIGWDPRVQQFHSWVFDASGGFGDGSWVRDGDDWLVRMTFTTSDGRLITGTQVLTHVSNDEMKVQLVGQEVDGDPIPSNDPVTVKRVQETEKAASR